jgi:hypothetical protein
LKIKVTFINKKAWDLALSPAKSIPMNAFMLYMSGNSVQIFSIMVTVMLLWNSANAILNSMTSFEQFSNQEKQVGMLQTLTSLINSKLHFPVLVFVLMNSANFALGVWKCGSMGLLPTTTSDWLSFMEPKSMLELGVAGFSL